MEIVKKEEHTEIWVRFHSIDPSETATAEQVAELRKLLGVPPELDRVRVIFATRAPEPAVVGVRTRSLLQILVTLGAGVQVQQDHLTNGTAISVDTSQVPRRFMASVDTQNRPVVDT